MPTSAKIFSGRYLSVRYSGAGPTVNVCFPAFKLLPAVAQVDMVALLAHALLDTPRAVQRIQRTKFSYPVLPDVQTNLEMSYKAAL